MYKEKLEINEIILYPNLGFRVNGGSNNLYSELIDYIDQNIYLSSEDLQYQGQIAFYIETYEMKNLSELIKILKELDKYIDNDEGGTLLEFIENNMKFYLDIFNKKIK